ncbi:adrenodoxin-like protein 2, mitochondrial [Aplysia californica]|uniref:Adrenodoxin-like protein 2, mitochondrial n=1 Tax=Aplysia californica TaxID=6500 RepID=A0ABM0JP41_APLCA|nr:adrenodoxin-like protein 2, mitochondrial [Aplysia californica]
MAFRLLSRILRASQKSGLSVSSFSKLRVSSHYLMNACRLSSSAPKPQKETINVTFLLRDGEKQEVQAKVGDNLLDIIIEHDVDIDGFGACEGTLACSTCHLIFKQSDFDKIPDKPTDEELDMLDLAYGLTDTSRLGCQVVLTKDMDGLEVTVPTGVADARGGPL